MTNYKIEKPKPLIEIARKEISGTEAPGGVAPENKKTQKVADYLVGLTISEGCDLFLDQFNDPHITFPDRPAVGYPLQGGQFRRWLAGLYWKLEMKGFSNKAFMQAQASLEGRAHFENQKKVLYNRVARIEDTIYYDLGDDKTIVRIDRNGWEALEAREAFFRRYTHQRQQVVPERGGNLSDILRFVNFKNKNDRLLFLTYLVAVLFPDIPRTLIIAIGEQGSAKSSLLRVARSLIDPSRIELLKMRSSVDELVQMASHHYCLYLDNLSYLSSTGSDSLAGFVTGLGFSKRKLFTDQEDIVFELKVAVGITGINLVAEKSDLLDRCLIFSLERITDTARRGEAEFWNEFEKAKPLILGTLFDVVSQTLAVMDKVRLPQKPRMADYAHVAAAASLALGKSVEDFLSAFKANVERQNRAAVDSSPVAQTMIEFMEDMDEWTGAASELYELLKRIAEKNNLRVGGSTGYPADSNWLWRKINLVRSNLTALGIEASRSEEEFNNVITLSKVRKNATNATSTTSQPQNQMVVDKNATSMPPGNENATMKSSLNLEALEALEAYPQDSEGMQEYEPEGREEPL